MKLLNINVGIKIDNTKKVADFIKQENTDFVVLQEVVRHLEDSVFKEFRSKAGIDEIVKEIYHSKFFGPLWITDAFRKEGKIHRNFGGHIEQGNYFLSKYPIINADNEHYYMSSIPFVAQCF